MLMCWYVERRRVAAAVSASAEDAASRCGVALRPSVTDAGVNG